MRGIQRKRFRESSDGDVFTAFNVNVFFPPVASAGVSILESRILHQLFIGTSRKSVSKFTITTRSKKKKKTSVPHPCQGESHMYTARARARSITS